MKITDNTFLDEYSSQAAVRKYSKATAGYGINYLLEHDYKEIYLQAIRMLPPEVQKRPLRLLEYGCGAGMNLLHLVSMLESEGISVESAVGADFSPTLIETANQEAREYAQAEHRQKTIFFVARNESLVEGLSQGFGKPPAALKASFDFIFGVNTIRYCHRANKQDDCALGIYDLLIPGGMSVAIDMNNRFPLFRSTLRDRVQKSREEYYLPSLEEYTEPFRKAGFEVIRSEHFSWIPHSFGKTMCRWLVRFSPVLNTVAKSRAMRSLVVSRKPLSAR